MTWLHSDIVPHSHALESAAPMFIAAALVSLVMAGGIVLYRRRKS